ncbi:hypothetical protein SAMN02745206_00195 [Desulfacinum infernum DSM 9756]|uniref:Uncharacterized protein n=1 Tax=Desulfacinum infernum DSM 9756 TaxID=1121391 RepID=A0A1M4SVH4_9BACT|nr:hypothetical protein [Desulfacinum infernum]SHE36205.1 hypothetical protein SAMN02745206_00195 [Desulfacinum infernum DSM 9756]
MKGRHFIGLLVFAAMLWGLWAGPPAAWAEETGFTRQDRDLLIELRTRMLEIDKRFEQIDKRFEQLEKRFEQIDRRFEDVDKRFEQLMDFLYILAGIFTSLVIAVIGFAYWDRRTIISQAKKETREDLEREGRLRDVILALREYAAKNEDLAAILKSFHLL